MARKPQVGQKAKLNGKDVVYSGTNYGYQSPASHKNLEQQGKFRQGAQALDRVGSAIANSRVGKAVSGGLTAARKATDKIPGIEQVDRLGRAVEKAADKTPTGLAARGSGIVNENVSKATNVDSRITGAAAAAVTRGVTSKGPQGPAISAKARGLVNAAESANGVNYYAGGARTRERPTATAVGPRLRANAAKKAAEQAASTQQANRLRQGVRGAATRQSANPSPATVTRTQQLPKPRGTNGERLFTPTNRAKAVQRSNERQARVKGYITDDGTSHHYMRTGGMESTSHVSPRFGEDGLKVRNTGNAKTELQKRRLNKDHDVSFRQKSMDGDHHRPQEYGIRPTKKSRVSKEITSANVQDQLGHHLKRVRTGDHVRATPINDIDKRTGELRSTSARARYYSQKSNKALASTKVSVPDINVKIHDVNARRGSGNTWTNPANSKSVGNGRSVQRDVKWDPNDLHKPIAKLAKDTPRTLLGRRAGGNSNIKVKVNKTASPRSVGAAARQDVAGSGGRQLYRPAVKGAVTKSGQAIKGRTSEYRVNIGSKTKTNTPTARRLAAQTSPAARRNDAVTTSRRVSSITPTVSPKRPKASSRSIPVGGPITASRGKPLKGNVTRVKTPAGAKPRIRTQRTVPAIQGRMARYLEAAKTGSKVPTKSTRLATGVRNDSTVRPPRSRSTSPTRTERSRTLRSGLRDRGSQYVRDTLPRGSVSNQVRGNRYSTNRGGGSMPTYGATNARRTAAAQATAPRSGGVRNNAQTAGRQAVDRFEARARTIVNNRIRNEGASMDSRGRQSLTRRLQQQMRQGSNRVRAAAERQSTASQNNTRSNTVNFRGTGRTSYQETNRMDRRGGRSEAQTRRLAGRVRTTRTTPQGTRTSVSGREVTNNPRVSPAVNMRRRQSR